MSIIRHKQKQRRNDTQPPASFADWDWQALRSHAADAGVYKVGMNKEAVIAALEALL